MTTQAGASDLLDIGKQVESLDQLIHDQMRALGETVAQIKTIFDGDESIDLEILSGQDLTHENVPQDSDYVLKFKRVSTGSEVFVPLMIGTQGAQDNQRHMTHFEEAGYLESMPSYKRVWHAATIWIGTGEDTASIKELVKDRRAFGEFITGKDTVITGYDLTVKDSASVHGFRPYDPSKLGFGHPGRTMGAEAVSYISGTRAAFIETVQEYAKTQLDARDLLNSSEDPTLSRRLDFEKRMLAAQAGNDSPA